MNILLHKKRKQMKIEINDTVRIKAFNFTRRYRWPAIVKIAYRIISKDEEINNIKAYRMCLNWSKENSIISRASNVQEIIKKDSKHTTIKAEDRNIYQLDTEVPIKDKEYKIDTIYYVTEYSNTYKKQPETMYHLEWYWIVSETFIDNLFTLQTQQWEDEK